MAGIRPDTAYCQAMPSLQDGIAAVQRAENDVRRLIGEAATSQDYDSVAALAALANGLLGLISYAKDQGAVPKHQTPSKTRPDRIPARAASPLPPTPYPHFYKDGDKLVKVGWSKKEDREYEHRAPQSAVIAIASRAAAASKGSKVFDFGKLADAKTEGGDIPSYQAYLTVAWLRDIGAIRQCGRDGYAAVNGRLEPKQVEAAWNSVEQR
jgi:hypothetical protein